MIRTNEYIVVKKIKNKWRLTREYGCIDAYSLKDANDVLRNIQNGEIMGHSKNGEYKIMEICYCELRD